MQLYAQQIIQQINLELKFPSLRLSFLWVGHTKWKMKCLLEFIVPYIIKLSTNID